MKRYLLFAGVKYYASGGINDLIDTSDDLNSLIENAKNTDYEYKDWFGNDLEFDWWHIYDTQKGEIVVGTRVQAHNAIDLDDEVAIDRE